MTGAARRASRAEGASGGEHEHLSAVMARRATWARLAQAARQRGLELGQWLVVAAAGTVPEQLALTPAGSLPRGPARPRVGWERLAQLDPPGRLPGAAGGGPARGPSRSAGRATNERPLAGLSAHVRVAGRAPLAPPDRRPAGRPRGRPLAAAAPRPRRPLLPGSPRRPRAVPSAQLVRNRRSVRQ
jgi:hypothetical protein